MSDPTTEGPASASPAPPQKLLRLALASTGAGALTSLALFLRAGPYTLVLFMFVGQPLLLLGFGLFTLVVLRDLRSRQVL